MSARKKGRSTMAAQIAHHFSLNDKLAEISAVSRLAKRDYDEPCSLHGGVR